MKSGAIFDMDGLLFDTERLYRESWVIAAEQFGQTSQSEFPRAVCGTSGAHMLEIIRQYYPAVDAKAFMQFCIKRVTELVKIDVPEKPGIHEIIRYFSQQGVKLAVASSSKYETIEGNLQQANVLQYFDVLVSGDQVEHGKPAPDVFLKAAELLGCVPEDCYVFEDGRNGIRAGSAAGCATIMIPDLTPPDEELQTLCEGIYPSLMDALEAIKKGEI